MCPKGDDPFTYFSDYRAIIITLNAYSAGFSGSFKLTYDSLTISIPASDWTDELCQQAFQALPAFKTVRCSLSFSSTRYGGFSLQVEFIEFAPIPYQNNIYTHEGDPLLSAFKCDTSGIVTTGSVTCGITNVVYGSLPGNMTLYAAHCFTINLNSLSFCHLNAKQNMCIAPTAALATRPQVCASATATSSRPTVGRSATACGPSTRCA